MNILNKVLAGLTLGAALTAPSLAQKSGSDGPVTIIVPFGTGNGLDVMARNYAVQLGQQTKTPFIVDNKEGAGGLIGTMAAARAAPNGRTLLFTAEYPFLTTPYMQPGQTYHPTTDFVPVARVATAPHVLVVGQNSPFKTVKDVVQFAKSHPGQLSFASSGVGTPSQLYLEKFLKDLGVEATHVPYKSTGTATTDVMSGQVQLYMPSIAAVMPFLHDGKLRALAVGSSTRVAKLPEVPTLAELLKQPGQTAYVWFGFLAPKGTPAQVVERLQHNIEMATQAPAVVEMFKQTDAQFALAGTQQFAADIGAGDQRARGLLRLVGVLPN